MNIEKPNFKKICFMHMQQLTNFPYIEKDFDALTDYELLCKVVEYLNKVIANENEQNETILGLYNGFNALKDYVENYFDNLDVQDEINNKLDEMAESGELTDIIAQYLGLAGMIAFNTVADMKLAENLVNGSKCETLGYHSVNDGGKAIYLVRYITNSDVVDEGALIALHDQNLVAELMEKDKVTPEMFGAYGDNTHDDYQAIQKAIDYINGGIVELQSKTYIVGNTLKIHRGLNLRGISSYGEENAVLKLKDNTNKSIIETPSSSTHYMIIENLKFDGNKNNQTEEVTILKFHGAFIGSILRNISIRSFFGTALSLQITDCQLDNIWIQNGYTLSNKYAIHINPTISSSEIYSMINANNIYVENYSNKLNGNPRDNEEDRADGIMIYRVASININEIHFEGCKTPITSLGPNVIRINMIRSANCGNSQDNTNSLIYLNSYVRLLSITNAFSTINSVYSYWVNRSFANNDIPIVPKKSNSLTLPSYNTEQSTENTANYLQKTYFSNEAFSNKIESYNQPKIGVSSNVGKSYMALEGQNTIIATDINQNSAKTFIKLTSTGGNSDNIVLYAPVLYTSRSSSSGIQPFSIYTFNNNTNVFPALQRTINSANRIVSLRIGTTAPSDIPWYIGEMYLDSTNKKLYIATETSSASDWTILN